MRVLLALGHYEWGGFKTVVVSLAKYMSRLGIDVHIAVLKVGDVGSKDEIYHKLKVLTPKEFIREAMKFDIVHIHTTYPYTREAIKAGLKNIVFTYHGYCPWHLTPGFKNKVIHLALKYAYRRLLPKIRKITAISNFVKRQLEEIYGISNVKVIYNGVDLEIFKPIKIQGKSGYPILFNAMAHEKLKGLDIALKYFRNIKDFYPEAKLILGGTSIDAIKLIKRYCSKFRSSFGRDVLTLSYVPQSKLAYYYSLSDVYFLTSRWESFGLPIVESFTCGTPVIAFKVDDARIEHIVNSKAGELFNDNESLIQALDKILRNYHEYSARAINYARKLSWENIVKQYLEVYNEVLSS